MQIKKYDIFVVNLDPKKWHVQAGKRPCVVLQNNTFNEYAPTLIVCPLTTTEKTPFPSEFFIFPSKNNGLSSVSRFLGSQILTIDKHYFWEKLGELETKYHDQIQNTLHLVFDLDDEY